MKKSTCAFCKTEFEHKGMRTCCSVECGRQNMGKIQEEKDRVYKARREYRKTHLTEREIYT